MSSGSLKSVSRSIESLLSHDLLTLSNDGSELSLDPETAENIMLYMEKHAPIDQTESIRLHDELVRIHKAYVINVNNTNTEILFIKCLIELVPCLLLNSKSIEEWYGRYSEPAIISAGHKNSLVKISREFILSLLLLSGINKDDDTTGRFEICQKNSRKVARLVLLEFLKGDDGNYSFTTNILKGGEEYLKLEERRRFSKLNAQNLLIQYGMKSPKEFLTVLNDKFLDSKARIQLLSLLSSYVSEQPPFLFQIRNTELLKNLYKCLIYDKSSFGLSICSSALAMTLPHICDILVDELPLLFSIYGRLCSWQLELGSEEDILGSEGEEDGSDDEKRNKEKVDKDPSSWQVLNNLIDIQDPRGPMVTPLFTFLYGLFPANLIAFLRQPDEYLSQAGFTKPFDDFWDRHSIQRASKQCFALHTLNPSLLTISKRQELTDNNRWQFMGSAFDIASECLSLSIPRVIEKRFSSQPQTSVSSKPLFRVPFEENEEGGSGQDLGGLGNSLTFPSSSSTPSLENPQSAPILPEGSSQPTSTVLSGILTDPLPDTSTTTTTAKRPSGTLVSSRHSSNLDPISREDSITSPTNLRSNILSPNLTNVETLLSEHEKLYTRKEFFPPLEKRDSIVTIPEEFNLDDGVASNSLATLRRGRSATLSSPGFYSANGNGQPAAINTSVGTGTGTSTTLPPSIQSPLLLSQPNSVAAAAASTIAAASNTNTGTTTSPNIMSTSSPTNPPLSATAASEQQKQLEKQFNLAIAFYQRELLLIRNELEFVSFIEHQTQHRFSKLRERLKESTLANSQIDKLILHNKALKAKLEKPELEAIKSQKSLRTYKSERQAYEAALVQKNKDFRLQINTLKQEMESAKTELESIQKERQILLKSINLQETKISKMELELTDCNERITFYESQQKVVEEMKKRLEKLEETKDENELNGTISDPNIKQIEELQIKCQELTMSFNTIELEKKQLISSYNRRIEELETLLSDYEEKMNFNGASTASSSNDIGEFIKSFKEASELRYNQLQNAYNELTVNFDSLSARFREVLLTDEEHKARIDQPVLPKRSLLGYEMVPEEEPEGSNSNSGANSGGTTANMIPKLSRSTTETRIRGRGGVQNTSSNPSNSPTNSGAPTKRRSFRGF